MQFTTTSKKAYTLEENATGMDKGKNQQNFFFNLEKQRAKHNRKNLLLMVRKLQNQTHILECVKEFYETLF